MGFNGPRFLNPPPSHPLWEEGYYSIFYPFKYNKFFFFLPTCTFLFFAYKSMVRNRKQKTEKQETEKQETEDLISI